MIYFARVEQDGSIKIGRSLAIIALSFWIVAVIVLICFYVMITREDPNHRLIRQLAEIHAEQAKEVAREETRQEEIRAAEAREKEAREEEARKVEADRQLKASWRYRWDHHLP